MRVEADHAWLATNASGAEKGYRAGRHRPVRSSVFSCASCSAAARWPMNWRARTTPSCSRSVKRRLGLANSRWSSSRIRRRFSSLILQGRIEYVNDMFVKTSGYERNEVIGKLATLLGAETEAGAAYREMHEAIMSGRVWHGELPSRRRTGGIYWERVLIAPVKDGEAHDH